MIFPVAFEIAAFLLGLLFGSFLNVCIVRLPRHESLWHPRSHCQNCGRTIRWYDNVPLASWVLLRGRCRDCGKGVSWRYPAVELVVGLLFYIAGAGLIYAIQFSANIGQTIAINRLKYGYTGPPIIIPSLPITPVVLTIVSFTTLGFLLIGLMVMDWRTHKLPDAFTLPGILIGFFLTCVQAAFLAPGELDIHFDPQRSLRLSSPGSFVAKGDVFMTGPEHLVLGQLMAIAAAGGLLVIIRWLYLKLRRREGMGLGDAKLLAMIAAFLGFWPAMVAFFFGVVLCSVYAMTLMARRQATAVTQLPLGTFLCMGGLVAMAYGEQIIAWYTSLLSTSAVLTHS